MDWAFDSLSCYYRSGFDLSVPLRPKALFPEYESTPPTAREYFLTFKVCVNTVRLVVPNGPPAR